MPRPGLCVGREGAPLWRPTSVSATAIRVVLAHWIDLTGFLTECHGAGIETIGVMDRDAFEDWGDWHNSVDGDLARVSKLVDAGLLDYLLIGNEWDDGWAGPGMNDDPRIESRGGVSSWVLPFSQIGEMVNRAADHFNGSIPLILGGMSSGQPAAIDGLDLSRVQGISIHPYGKAPSPDWPAPNWGTGFIGYWLDALRQRLDARGLTQTCRIIIGELGLNKYENGPDLVAEWFKRMLSYLEQRGDVDSTCIFADSDLNVDGYGLYRADEGAEPSTVTVTEIYRRWAVQNPPVLILPQPVPEPEPEPPNPIPPADGWWDRIFSAEDIASIVSGVMGKSYETTLDQVRRNWPEFEAYMREDSMRSVRNRAGIIATIAVEADGFDPIDEYGDYNYFESNYGPQTRTGQQLGNIYTGDGALFHGRGYIMITGRSNYTIIGQQMGIDLANDPDMAKDPAVAAGIFVNYWLSHGIPAQADAGNWENVRRAVNGGTNGYDKFIAIVNDLIAVAHELVPVPDPPIDLTAILQGVINEAERYLGVPYVWGGHTPAGFDCLVAGTGVLTDRGEILIEQVLPGDRVLTRNGYRPILGAWLAGERDVYEVTLSNGESLIGTRNHQVLTACGWKALSTLTKSDMLLGCDQKPSTSTGSGTTDTPSLRDDPIVTTFSALVSHSMLPSGRRRMDARFDQGTRFTTSTMTPPTTIHRTWKRFRSPGIEPSRPMHGLIVSEPALSVGSHSRRSQGLATPATDGIVLAAASRHGAERSDWIAATLSAMAAAPASRPSTSGDNAIAAIAAGHSVVGVTNVAVSRGKALTYDLEVDGQHDFFANGVLVSNCSGFVSYVNKQVLGVSLATFTDAIFDETDPIASPLPGDIVLFEYLDSSQPGVRFPHVGFVTDTDDLTLDARGGVGVGYHPYVTGAVVYYRRVRGLASVQPGEDPAVIAELQAALEHERIIRDHLTTDIPAALQTIHDNAEVMRASWHIPTPRPPKVDAHAMAKWVKPKIIDHALDLQTDDATLEAVVNNAYKEVDETVKIELRNVIAEIQRHSLENMPLGG